VSATVSASCERYGIPYVAADSSSPSLHRRGLKFFFRPAAHDEMFSKAMFDFMDELKKKGKKIETVGLFFEDTIFGTCLLQRAAQARRRARLQGGRRHQVPLLLAVADRRGAAAQERQPRRAAAVELHHRHHPADEDHGRARLQAGQHPGAGGGLLRQGDLRRGGRQAQRHDLARSFSLDLAAKRPSVGKVNDMFKARAGRDLNDNTSRQLTCVLVLADAIDRAKSTDGEKIRAALVATDTPGEQTIMPWKRVKFSAEGQNDDADGAAAVSRRQVHHRVPAQAAIAEAKWPLNG